MYQDESYKFCKFSQVLISVPLLDEIKNLAVYTLFDINYMI